MKNDKRQAAGTIVALIGGTCQGFLGCCGQYLFEQKGIEASQLVAVRLFFVGIILVLAGFKLYDRDNLRVFRKKRDTIHLLAFAIFGITFCQFTYFMTVQASNVETTTVLQYLSPILILVVVYMRELRPPKRPELAAIGLSLFDTFIIGTHGDIHSFRITGEALFWGLLAATSPMIYTIVSGGLILKYDIYQMLGFGMFFGGTTTRAVVRPWSCGAAWDAGTVGALADVAVVGTAIIFGLYLQGVSMIGPLKGSIMGSVEPVFAVVISVSWLGIWSALFDFLGFAPILGTVFAFTFAHRPGEETAKGVDFFADS